MILASSASGSGSSLSSLQLSCNSIEKTAARYRSDLAGVIDLSSIPMILIV
jgi:hypothetical protein